MSAAERAPTWRGIHKLQEEIGELGQVLGKIGAYPVGRHPDGGPPLLDRAEEELADVIAAAHFFIQANQLDHEKILARIDEKFAKFKHWNLPGV